MPAGDQNDDERAKEQADDATKKLDTAGWRKGEVASEQHDQDDEEIDDSTRSIDQCQPKPGDGGNIFSFSFGMVDSLRKCFC